MPRFDSVRQLPSGRWQGRYRGPDGKTHAKTFPTAREASDWVVSNKEDQRVGAWVSPDGGRTLLGEWADRWAATRVDVRPSTAARDLSYTENHIQPAFGNLRLDSIDQTDVREWVARLCRRGLAPATVQKAYQILAQMMGAAVDAKVIRVSPCYNVPLPKVEREEMRFLNPGEIDRLVFALAEPRDQALVLLGCYGGLRIGELAGLNRQHVELDKGRVRVAQAAVEVRGHVSLNPPKTKAGRRTIALPCTVVESLKYVLAKHTAPEPEAPLFATGDGRRGYRR